MLKKIYAAAVLCTISFFTPQVKAQSLADAKEKQELLKVYNELFDKNVELAKEREENIKLLEIVNGLNKRSDKTTDKFSSSDPRSTSEDAKKTAKLLKKTESANRDLLKSNAKIKDIESDISKIVSKMEKFNYVIEIKNK